MPDEARMRKLLDTPGQITFIAEYCEVLDGLDSKDIGAFHGTLTAGLEKGAWPRRHAENATNLAELCWAKLDPKGFLEVCAARKRRYSLDAQLAALGDLLKTDLELALRLYLLVPLNEVLPMRCKFYDRLAAIDPPRAVKFLFETSECERRVNNPIGISFEAWARRDFDAAMAKAVTISNDEWLWAARSAVLKVAAIKQIDKLYGFLDSISDPQQKNLIAGHLISHRNFITAPQAIEIARRIDTVELWIQLAHSSHLGESPFAVRKLLEILPEQRRVPVLAAHVIGKKTLGKLSPEQVEELYALIPDEALRNSVRSAVGGQGGNVGQPAASPPADSVFEELLAGGSGAYEAITDGDKAANLAKAMFKRFPERSLPWLLQMKASARSYFSRDLAGAWPPKKVAADTSRLLESADPLEKVFGIELAKRWLARDPETAVPVLFSRHAALAEKFRKAIPLDSLLYEKKWTRERIGKFLEEIQDPNGRAVARKEWVLNSVRYLPPGESLAQILAIQDRADLVQAADDFVSRGVRDFTDSVVTLTLGIGPQHLEIRDRMLSQLAGYVANDRKADASRLLEVLTAIQDPDLRIKAMGESGPSIHRERLIGLLATMPPSGGRDRRIKAFIAGLPHEDAVLLAKKTELPLVRRMALECLGLIDIADAAAVECQALLVTLPPAYRDKHLTDLWFANQARRNPAAYWPEVEKRVSEDEAFYPLAVTVLQAWQNKDPLAARDTLTAAGSSSRFGGYLEGMILSAARKDPRGTFADLLARPVGRHHILKQVMTIWSESDPRAACAACLRIEETATRRDLLRTCLTKWALKDANAAVSWVRGLPRGPEHYQATLGLSMSLPKDQAKLVDELLWEACCGNPGFDPNLPLGSLNEACRIPLERRAKASAEARLAVRSLADLDFETVAASTSKMPAGEARDLARLGLLDHALNRKKEDLAAALTADMLAENKPLLAEVVATTVIGAIGLEHADKAVRFAEDLRSPEARFAAAAAIISRWHAAEHRAMVQKLIRGFPDARLRQSLANRFMLSLMTEEKNDPQALRPYLETALQRAVITTSRADLASALLDGRVSDAEAAIQALPEGASRAKLQEWIKQQITEGR